VREQNTPYQAVIDRDGMVRDKFIDVREVSFGLQY
jgi:hypothetical protein